MTRRVTFLVPFAFGMGGIPRAVFKLGGELVDRGHEVEVISVVRRTDEPFLRVHPAILLDSLIDLRDPEHEGQTLPRPRARSGFLSRRARLDRKPTGLTSDGHKVFSALTDELLSEKVASIRGGVIVATRPEFAVAAVRGSQPGVITVLQEMNSIVDRGEGLLEAIVGITRADAPRRLDAFLTLTESELAKWKAVIGETATHLEAVPVPNSFDIGPQAALESRTVVAAGRLSRQKGFDLLIRAWTRVATEHPDWKLEIHGSGSRRRSLMELAESLGVQSSVAMPGASTDMEAVLARASVFVLSSRFEGFGLVIVEAMSKGVPVVSFDCPEGPSLLIDDGINGLLVENGDVDALSGSLIKVIEDRPLRMRLGSAGMATAAEYDVRAVADRWESLFAELESRK